MQDIEIHGVISSSSIVTSRLSVQEVKREPYRTDDLTMERYLHGHEDHGHEDHGDLTVVFDHGAENRVIHCSHPSSFCPLRQQLIRFNALGSQQLL